MLYSTKSLWESTFTACIHHLRPENKPRQGWHPASLHRFSNSQRCDAVSPLYPTNLNLPIISPTVKNPRSSAEITAPAAICRLLRFRIRPR